MNVDKIVLSSDHAGFELKELIKDYLSHQKYQVIDLGPSEPVRCDYPNKAWEVATLIAQDSADIGILICGTGIGVSIAANRHPLIRAALAHDEFTAEMARAHNDAQILCLGARVLNSQESIKIVNRFLSTSFEGGRHLRRVNLLSQLPTDVYQFPPEVSQLNDEEGER